MPFRPTRIAAPTLVFALLLGLWSSRAGVDALSVEAAPTPPAHAAEAPASRHGGSHVGELERRLRPLAPPPTKPAKEPSEPPRGEKTRAKEPAGAPRNADRPDAKRAAARPAKAKEKRKEKAKAKAKAKAKLPPRGSVAGAVARAHRRGAIGAREEARYRRIWQRVRHLSRRAGGGELKAVAGIVRRVAERRRLRPDRMPTLFLQMGRNIQLVRSGRRPAAGERVTFGRDPIIFQYIPGQGLQFHPLANFAEANRLRNACVGYRTRPGVPCRKRRLARLADRLAALASERGGFTTWEYYFDFSGGRAPWISGMAQATGMQALSRAGKLLKRRRYVRIARAARGAFSKPAPIGVRTGDGRYAMYSFAPHLVVLNGLLQTVSGLHDYAKIARDGRARRLFSAGDRYARRIIPSFDTGSWSFYSQPGGRATREYHRLTSVFLRNLCERTERRSYCSAAKRFFSYL